MYYCLFFLPFVEHQFSIKKKMNRKKSQNNNKNNKETQTENSLQLMSEN